MHNHIQLPLVFVHIIVKDLRDVPNCIGSVHSVLVDRVRQGLQLSIDFFHYICASAFQHVCVARFLGVLFNK